jgi:predicted transcriptional regulator
VAIVRQTERERGYNGRMSPVKEQLIRLIQDQPEDSSFEEIVRELAFATMVERGLADSDAGRTISHEEMGRRIESWRS